MHDLRSNLPLLYDFYIVAKSKNITEAAETNNVSQPSLSRNIKLLEETLGLVLINRSNKGIELTKDGKELSEKLDVMFSTFNKFNDSYAKENNDLEGKLVIGTTRNIADNKLSKFLTLYHKMYPKVNINIFTDNVSNLNNLLLNHKIDVLFDYIPNTNFSEKDSIDVEPVSSFNTCFACSRAFYENYGKKITKITDLNNYELVIPGSSRRRQILELLLTPLHIKLNPKMQMPDSKLMADFVKENECIGYFIEEEVELYDLVPLKLDVEMPKNNVGVIYGKSTMSTVAKKFVDLVMENRDN